MSRFFDVRAILMIIIGCGILLAMFLLIGVVLCLYLKITKALNYSCRTAKDSVATVSCIGPCKITQDKIVRAKPIVESCRNIQCCDACSVYTDVGSLPPCFCNVSEGL
ncbi:protein FAM24A-like [Cricetulus griseus]|uniref:Family with sequence similarity 24 member B n=1 Tax=Cricetulus griseus TaxID=10029 RepID=A0A3L7HWR0_CRIGR|nr:protein FAM24A-like [Cricetulus griseus]XP_035317146.1 protein FAM24A-like [Cricetulus griseus]